MVTRLDGKKRLIRRNLVRFSNILLDEIEDLIEQEKRNKRKWVRDWIARRDTRGASAQILKELSSEDVHEYKMTLRMTPDNFEILLNMVTPRIQKQDTFLRDAIPAKIMLEITLYFLATGNYYRSLQLLFRVSKPTISNFIPLVCDAIYDSLKEYLKVPNTHEDWKRISDGFHNRWNFPLCCGAIDGKHILVTATGSEYYNYKGTNSVVLMAVADFDYRITYFEVGKKGSESDGRVFQNCSLLDPLEKGLLPNGSFLVGDDAFPLKTFLMKPYSNNNRPLTEQERIFNYRLSRARRIIENVFGILVSRFRVFDRRLLVKIETVNKIVKATCALHNWLATTSKSTYLGRGTVDEERLDTGEVIPGQWRSEINTLRNLEPFGGNRSTNLAKKMRDRLKHFFNNEGAVTWQNNYV